MGTKHPTAGTITKGTKKYAIYQAILEFPSDQFTCKDIHKVVAKKRPDIDLYTVQNAVGFLFVKARIIKKTEKVREAEDSGRKLVIYERNLKAKQPIVREPGMRAKRKPIKKQSAARQAAGRAPTLTSTELGESVIDYINHLQNRVGELAIECDKNMTQLGDEKRAHQKTKDSMQYKIAELEKANDALKKQAEQGGGRRSFNTQDVLDFKERQRRTQDGVGS
ncbi:MAG: hypothetical protein AM326_01610 [Candidatus Thorarchaeota archaeon SMTZ-45]|nr:MAG: hypothetical protein AM326_01610 [Candidatus Thorarchaeota archaeon SMTZ-45]